MNYRHMFKYGSCYYDPQAHRMFLCTRRWMLLFVPRLLRRFVPIQYQPVIHEFEIHGDLPCQLPRECGEWRSGGLSPTEKLG